MGILLSYTLKSAFCLTLFYPAYRLLLSKETFHRFNRIALLTLLVLSYLLPLLSIGSVPSAMQESLVQSDLTAIPTVTETMPSTPTTATAMAGTERARTLLWIYLLGGIGCMGYQLMSFARLGTLLRKAKRAPLPHNLQGKHTRAQLYVHDEEVAPFSWMHLIVVSRTNLVENGRAILIHELAHIFHRHSWDLLLTDICLIVQWFNPTAWLLKQELRTLHEYEADDMVVKSGIDAKEYQTLLIKKVVGTRLYSMANNLNHSSLKKRITMMLKKKSNPWARLKYLSILPLAALSVAVFARPEVSNKLNEISSVKVTELTSIAKADEVKSSENSPAKLVNVSGKVINERTGKPIAGVSIVVMNPADGRIIAACVSSQNGKFSLDSYEGLAMRFSFVGMQEPKVIIPRGGSKSMTVTMREEAHSIPEMMVVAYAPEKKSYPVPEPKTSSSKGDEGEVFYIVEQAPEFPGGMGELMKFLQRNVKYPTAAQQAGIQGKVVVEFTVKKDGSVADIKVIRSVNPELDAEAMRVISVMPKWKPGEQRGTPVDARFDLPINFHLQK
ncbi:MAG: TonB family protein [Bacteroidaceae bacterium]|nr:TonB family protein [Bacteroidaceae bacterium]